VAGVAAGLDLLTSSEISLAAGGDLFAYYDTGRLSLGSLSRGRIFASMEGVASYSLFPERGQLLVRLLAGDSRLLVLSLAERQVVHAFQLDEIALLTTQTRNGLSVGYRGSDFQDDRRDDAVVVFDLSRLTTRDHTAACDIRRQDSAWGKGATLSGDGRHFAVAGPCGAQERVALYSTAAGRAQWWLDSWESTTEGGSLSFSEDGAWLLHVHPFGQQFEVIDTKTGRPVARWKSTTRPLRHTAFGGQDVVLVISDNDVEQPWRFGLRSREPVRDDTLLQDWRFLVADGLRYVGPWLSVPARSQALRVMVDGNLELVDRSGLRVWSIPLSQPVSIVDGDSPHFIVADDQANEFHDFVVTDSGVRWSPRTFAKACGDDCEALRVTLDENLRADYSENRSVLSLVDMQSGRSLNTCPSPSVAVASISLRYFVATSDERTRIVRWADCRTIWSEPQAHVELIDADRVIVTSDSLLRVLRLDADRPTELLRRPWSSDDGAYDYSAPGLLVVDTAESGIRDRLPRHQLTVHDLSKTPALSLMDEMADCQPFGQSVAADAIRGLVAIECNQSPSLVEHDEVRIFRVDGSRIAQIAIIPMPVNGELVFAAGGQLLVDAEGGPLLTAWRVPRTAEDRSTEPLFRLALSRDGTWTAVASDGRFDTNELETNRLLSWVLPNAGARPIAVEAFVREYYQPQLIKQLLTGEELPAVRPLAAVNRTLPEVTINSISEQATEPPLVHVTVDVRQIVDDAGAAGGLGEPSQVKLFMNGTLVESRELGRDFTLSNGAAQLLFMTRLPRATSGDEVTFTTYAYNQDQVKSEASVKGLRPTRSLVVQPKGRAVVVAIGVDATDADGWDLSFAVNDAIQMATVLSDGLRSTGRYDPVETIVLTSSRERDGSIKSTATKSHIANALERLGTVGQQGADPASVARNSDALGPDDLLVVAMSSHGISSTSGEFYLLPSDVGKDSKGVTFDLERAISSQDLAAWMMPVRAGSIALVIDACQSASVIAREGFKPGPMGSRDFGQLAFDKGMLVLTSSQSSEFSREVGAIRHGLLSYALVTQGLSGDQADRQPPDGRIDLREWLTFGAEQVPNVQSVLGEARTQQPALFDFVRRSVREVVPVKQIR
jgi:hypothetical protein